MAQVPTERNHCACSAGVAVVGTFLARPSAAVSGSAPLRNVAGSARWRRGRVARRRLLGGGCLGSAPGTRHLKRSTSPICPRTVGVRKGAGVGPAGLWMGGACSPKIGTRCYPEGAAVEAERRPRPSRRGGDCRTTFMGVLCCLRFKDRPGPGRIAPSPTISPSPPCRGS